VYKSGNNSSDLYIWLVDLRTEVFQSLNGLLMWISRVRYEYEREKKNGIGKRWKFGF